MLFNAGASFEFKMLSPSLDTIDDEFGRPVESIMRCEDFKSNFARRLSNRYISRSPVSGSRQDNALKLRPADKQEVQNNVSIYFIRHLIFILLIIIVRNRSLF